MIISVCGLTRSSPLSCTKRWTRKGEREIERVMRSVISLLCSLETNQTQESSFKPNWRPGRTHLTTSLQPAARSLQLSADRQRTDSSGVLENACEVLPGRENATTMVCCTMCYMVQVPGVSTCLRRRVRCWEDNPCTGALALLNPQ